MLERARRLLSRLSRGPARRALVPVTLWLAVTGMGLPANAKDIVAAEFRAPTTRYPHGALGDPVEHGTLAIRLDDGRAFLVELPETLVFEDTAPRLADIDGDGMAEVIVVESHRDVGARLAVWGLEGDKITRRAATPFLGTRFRWLAFAGTADLDGDGRTEIAYVETPHLGKTLKIVRLEGDRLTLIAQSAGLTNHKLGDSFIQGGIANCDGRPTILTADARWARVIGTNLVAGALRSQDMGAYKSPRSLDHVAGCD